MLKFLQRPSLPPGLLIETAQTFWTLGWKIMMGQLAPSNDTGEYVRPVSAFRHWINADPTHPFPAADRRYQLIVGWSCPWAHRTLIVRALKGLQKCIEVIMVNPEPAAGGWVFPEPILVNSQLCHSLREFYQTVQPGYSGRSTVPVLWDTQRPGIVNNESADIIEMLNTAFQPWAVPTAPDLYPEPLKAAIDRWNDRIYTTVNNGVYRCGFAQTQTAYAQACKDLFDTLDEIEVTLAQRSFLCGDQITLADVRLFTTLIRFDLVYAGLFKCSQKAIADYPNLVKYRRRIYHLPGVAETCNLEAIKQDYYGNLFPLNPGGIIPLTSCYGLDETAAL